MCMSSSQPPRSMGKALDISWSNLQFYDFRGLRASEPGASVGAAIGSPKHEHEDADAPNKVFQHASYIQPFNHNVGSVSLCGLWGP